MLLLKRQDRWLERAPRDAGDALARFFQVRAHLRRVLGEEGRSDSSCAVLMVDVDRFAGFNQRYGRPSGNHVLDRIGAVIQANLMRSGDQVARWRGDRFLVVLPNTAALDAPIVARRLLEAVQALGIGHTGTPSGVVTVSIGIASRPAWRRQHARRLLRDADAALQRAKGDGRNRWDSDVLPFDASPQSITVAGAA
jgi:diguanylate cyclase (GGDEF)-like protein